MSTGSGILLQGSFILCLLAAACMILMLCHRKHRIQLLRDLLQSLLSMDHTLLTRLRERGGLHHYCEPRDIPLGLILEKRAVLRKFTHVGYSSPHGADQAIEGFQQEASRNALYGEIHTLVEDVGSDYRLLWWLRSSDHDLREELKSLEEPFPEQEIYYFRLNTLQGMCWSATRGIPMAELLDPDDYPPELFEIAKKIVAKYRPAIEPDSSEDPTA